MLPPWEEQSSAADRDHHSVTGMLQAGTLGCVGSSWVRSVEPGKPSQLEEALSQGMGDELKFVRVINVLVGAVVGIPDG